MKKWIALMLCLLLAVGCFTGCDKEESTEVTDETSETTEIVETEEEESDVAAEAQTLTVYTDLTEGSPDYAAYMEKVAAFEEATGAAVSVSHYGENLSVVLDNAIADGSVDVFSVENLSELRMRMGDALNLSTYADDYDASYPILMEQIKATAVAGALFGLPTDANVTAMWYNKAAFEKAGVKDVPKNEKEFEALCQTLADAGFRPIALDSAYVHANFGIHMERALGSAELSSLVQNGGWSDNKAAINACQTLIDWVADGYFDENAPVDWPFSQLGLADRTAMIYADESTLAIVEEMIGTDIEWGCFAYPGESNSVLTDCGALCINAVTLSPQLAWEFISFMAEPAVDAEAAEILTDADSICDAAAIIKSGADLTEVIENIYRGTYTDGVEAAAALDALY